MTVTLERVESLPAVDAAIGDALALARSAGDIVLMSVAEPLTSPIDPLHFLRRASGTLGGGILWSQPSGASFAGAGSALDLRGSGAERFGDVSSAVRSLRGRLVEAGASAPFPILGGFAFSDNPQPEDRWGDFPDARLVVPSVLLQETTGTSVLRITVPVTSASAPIAVQDDIAKLSFRARMWINAEAESGLGTPFAPQADYLGRRAGFSRLPNPCQPVPSGLGAAELRAQSGIGHDKIGRRSVPDRATWESSVATAVARIRQGALAKVVLAREERIESPRPFAAINTLERLRAADPKATLFAMRAGAAWFVGATPERLVRLERGRVDVTCLAGSIGIGESDREREMLAARLLASEKDRHEHEIVVDSTMAALRDVCDVVQRETGTPRVVVARSVQHLETPVTGYLAAEGQVLDLVARLHPTPAVGGFPRDRALAVIPELESIDRGWYAGPFGWTDLDGSGEFSVAIRSALLRGESASVFAGGGIVADSDPAAEFNETCLKMRPMLAALGAA